MYDAMYAFLLIVSRSFKSENVPWIVPLIYLQFLGSFRKTSEINSYKTLLNLDSFGLFSLFINILTLKENYLLEKVKSVTA